MHSGNNSPSLQEKAHTNQCDMFCPKKGANLKTFPDPIWFSQRLYETGNRPSLQLMANPILYVLESSYYPRKQTLAFPVWNFGSS